MTMTTDSGAPLIGRPDDQGGDLAVAETVRVTLHTLWRCHQRSQPNVRFNDVNVRHAIRELHRERHGQIRRERVAVALAALETAGLADSATVRDVKWYALTEAGNDAAVELSRDPDFATVGA
jgi:hypothetical protein